MKATLTFLPHIGFRQAGLRLAREHRVEQDGRTLTVTQFVSTPDGTDLTYEIHDPALGGASCVVPGRGPSLFDPDKVTLREGDADHGAAFITSSGAIVGGVRRTLQARPLPPGAQAIEVRIESATFGEWRVPLELEEFGAYGAGQLHFVDASATHEDITVHVRGISLTPTATVVRFEAATSEGAQRIIGVGGLHGMRAGDTELRLRDEHGREYAELPKRDAREPLDRSELAVFPVLPDDATFVSADRSFRQLQDIQHGIVPANDLPDGDAIYATGPDRRRNATVITVDRVSDRLLRALAGRYGTAAIVIHVDPDRPRIGY